MSDELRAALEDIRVRASGRDPLPSPHACKADHQNVAMALSGLLGSLEQAARFTLARATPAPDRSAEERAHLADMVAVGEALMEAIELNGGHSAMKGWAPTDCPSEIVADLLNLLDEASEREAAAGRAEAWQDIGTAPKDGTRILVWSPIWNDGRPVFAQWDRDQHSKNPRPFWRTDTERFDGRDALRNKPPKWWMPAPSPPATAIRGSDDA